MKQLDKLDKYVRVPDVNFYGAYFYDGEDIELHNETEDFDDTILTIIDTIENGIFKKYKRLEVKSKKLVEESTVTYPLEKGQMLVYVENMGFTEVKGLVSLEDAINRLKMLDNKYYDENGNLK